MKWFNDLKTLHKLMLGFAVVCAIAAGVGYIGIRGMGSINNMLNRLYARDLVGLSAVKEANLHVALVGRSVRTAYSITDKSQMAKHTADIERYFSIIDEQLDKGAKTLATEEGKEIFVNIRNTLSAYRGEIKDSLRLIEAGDKQQAFEKLALARANGDRLDQLMARIAELKDKLGRQTHEESQTVYEDAMKTVGFSVLVAVLLGLGLGYKIAASVSRPLGEAVEVLEAVAGGDLTRSLHVTSKDEAGQMSDAVNRAVSGIREALSEVRQSAFSVSAASEELAASAEELSSGAQEQAASIEETAASLEEMTGSVKKNAESSVEASQLATGSRGAAENGGQVVSAAVQAMGEINTASKRIADIITAIDEIAFQTNLLALNAAVEAARAGDQGRGFAVVAGEVRNLAQRSATAAKEIKALIQDSVRKVDNGSALVNESGKTLDGIVASVRKVTDIVVEISAASREQATGIEQVNRAMTQMDHVTQATASQTEELSTTAQSLAAHAQQLQAMVSRFRLESANERRQAQQTPAPLQTHTSLPRPAALANPHRLAAPGEKALSRHSGSFEEIR